MKKYCIVYCLMVVCLICACVKKEVAVDVAGHLPEIPSVITEESLLADARAALGAQEDHKAYALYETYLKQFPQGAYVDEVLMQKGVIAQTRDDLDLALFDFRQLVNQYPQSPWVPDAQQKILEILFAQREYERVIEQADGALMVANENFRRVNIFRLLGDTYMLQAAYRAAVRAYAGAYDLAEGEAKESIAQKLEYAADQVPSADLQATVDDLAHGAAQGDLLFLTGRRLMDEGNYSDALTVFNEFIDSYPEHPQNFIALKTVDDLRNMTVERDTIGCLFPLSGPYAQFGAQALEGVELAQHQFSAGSGMQPVRIIVKDTGGDPHQALNAFHELAEAGVTAIIGPMVTADKVAPNAQRLGIPLMTLTQKEEIPQTGDYIFRNFITPRTQTDALVTYAMDHLGVKRFAVLYPSEKYGVAFMHHFWDQVLAHGGVVTRIEAYGPDQTDFGGAIKKLLTHAKKSGSTKGRADVDFEAIFIPDGPEKAGLVIPQLTYHDIEGVYLLGTNLWYSPQLVDMARQFVQGSILPVGFFPDAASWRITGFVDEFEAVFGKKPGFLEAIAYDTAMILFGIINRSEAANRNLIRDELLQLTDYPGVTGNTTFQTDGDVKKKMMMLTIKGNQFLELKP